METLHDKIMNIPIHKSKIPETIITELAYKSGYRDARHAAAELANEADETISELLWALEELIKSIQNRYVPSEIEERAINIIAKAKGEL